jgi:uncharacterized protein YbjT (DUF2867 family)
MTRIVMTGTTGHVGGAAVAELAGDGHELCQIVRDPARAPDLDGVETVVATGLDDRETLRATLRAGDRVFLVSAWTGHDERVRLHRAFIDAAAEAEVGHIVNLSFVNAGPDAAFTHARSHADTERDLRASGLPFSVLRTSYYHFNLEAFFVDGTVRGPSGRVGWVGRADCARALAGAMAGAAEVGETYDLTGPDAPTLAESAARAGELLGTSFAYVHEDEPTPVGPEWKLGIRTRGSRAIALGELDLVGDGVRRLTGREPESVDAYVRANPDAFRA